MPAPAGRRSAFRRSSTRRTRRSDAPCSSAAGSRSSTRHAAVRHAHDYGPVEFMKRYFDEYRGLHDASGHVERILSARARYAKCVRMLAGCASSGWTAGRRYPLAGALSGPPRRVGGRRRPWARARDRLPSRAQSALSLEGAGRPGGRSRAARSPDRRRGPRPLPVRSSD